jgi:2,4-dienoyl-CoA reductase-like NADH-dependent reductase (Old Yellow Enzyme family)
MYSAVEGFAQPWHFAHLSTFARGGAGLVFAEATAVDARGRITPDCLGIWNDAQAEALKPITAFIESMGSIPGIQLAHAGRKASTHSPFVKGAGTPLNSDDEAIGIPPWQTVAPSAIPVAPNWPVPLALDESGLNQVKAAFVEAASRAVVAGFRVIELHMAHGYLLHSFLSPISNQRDDSYGGSIENRMRFPLEVTDAVRAVIPDDMPLFSRISAIDGVDGGWTMEDSVRFSHEMRKHGVDVVDCSSGGIGGAPRFRIDDDGKPLTKDSARKPGFQVGFARQVKQEADIRSMAVGVIIDPDQAEEILQSGSADLVALGREIMYDPFWPLRAAEKFGIDPDFKLWPKQYGWAVNRRNQIADINRGE